MRDENASENHAAGASKRCTVVARELSRRGSNRFRSCWYLCTSVHRALPLQSVVPPLTNARQNVMNNALIAFCSKSAPKQLTHLNHLITGLSARLNDLSYKPASEHYYHPPEDWELGRECREAFRVLKKLEADENFRTCLLATPPVTTPTQQSTSSATPYPIFSAPKKRHVLPLQRSLPSVPIPWFYVTSPITGASTSMRY